ncbi:hypothetical protein C4K20_2137 [Pseudomonas chlororaphis subsp. aurantiaca]|nr:hypothetical protein C4K20_2137 [Pseudomonas chlororaphis subsp. aurantiaca]
MILLSPLSCVTERQPLFNVLVLLARHSCVRRVDRIEARPPSRVFY